MKQLYFLLFFLSTIFSYAQISDLSTDEEYSRDNLTTSKVSQNDRIDGLKMYPNPVTNGFVQIVSLDDSHKTIQIFNILGKQVLFKVLQGNTLDVSMLDSGIYIVKIRQKTKIATRKLVIK